MWCECQFAGEKRSFALFDSIMRSVDQNPYALPSVEFMIFDETPSTRPASVSLLAATAALKEDRIEQLTNFNTVKTATLLALANSRNQLVTDLPLIIGLTLSSFRCHHTLHYLQEQLVWRLSIFHRIAVSGSFLSKAKREQRRSSKCDIRSTPRFNWGHQSSAANLGL